MVKFSVDAGLAGGSVLGGPVVGPIVAGGGFALEVSGYKEKIVRGITVKILETQADHVVPSR